MTIWLKSRCLADRSMSGKARLVGDGCQLNRPHCQTVGASRTERSAARQVGDIVEWTKVLWCESVQDSGSVCLAWLKLWYVERG